MSADRGRSKEPRTVKLWCPSVSKMVPFMAWEDQKIDLGSIARLFGLDPSTVKLNGHFISRGVDLVSCSVTWRSLLNFFSAKGLSTGKDDEDALVVDGKLCKLGTKRSHIGQDAESWMQYRTESGQVGTTNRTRPEAVNSLTNKRLKEKHSESEESDQVSNWSGLGSKRKQLLEDVNLLKKLKINGSKADSEGGENNDHSVALSRQFKCSNMNENMKRMREEDAILAASCKRTR